MIGSKTSRKPRRTKVSNASICDFSCVSTERKKPIQKPFRFMDLPPEIRVIIYRFAIVHKSNHHWNSTCYTLVPPSIARVSQKTRIEVLPIFYGENSFDIGMDIDVIEYDEYDGPVKQDDNTKFEDFLRMCSCIINTGGLRYIKRLTLRYSEPVWEDMNNYLFGFELSDTEEGIDKRDRVGNNDLDWSDEHQVIAAVMTCMKKTVWKEHLRELCARVPVSNIIRVLVTIAKHCPHANQYVELWWDYGH